MHDDEKTEDEVPSPILGELGPPPGPDIDLSGRLRTGVSHFVSTLNLSHGVLFLLLTPVQYLLNCGPKDTEKHKHLSCHGGSSLRAYEHIHSTLRFVPVDTCLTYLACSSDSEEGWCPNVRHLNTCETWNVCRTCPPPASAGSEADDQGANLPSRPGLRKEGGDAGTYGIMEGATVETDAYGCQAIPPGSIPNVTISEYGSIEPGNIHAVQAEIYAR